MKPGAQITSRIMDVIWFLELLGRRVWTVHSPPRGHLIELSRYEMLRRVLVQTEKGLLKGDALCFKAYSSLCKDLYEDGFSALV